MKIPKEWNSAFPNNYIFKRELFLELLSTIPIVALYFIKHYFTERIMNNEVVEKRIGRPKKSLGELKSTSQKRERRKIFEKKLKMKIKFLFQNF